MTNKEARDYLIAHGNPDYPAGDTKWETALNLAIKALEKEEKKETEPARDAAIKPKTGK